MVENGDALPEEEEKQETKKKSLPWQRNMKKGKKANKGKGGGGGKKVSSRKETEDKKSSTNPSTKQTTKKEVDSESGSEDEENEIEEDDQSDQGETGVEEKSANDSSEPEKDDDQLEKLQSDVALRRQRLLEGKSQFSHSVHCPYFPLDKQEYWWAYITDRKQQVLFTPICHITNLVEHEEIQLKFTAPSKPGLYSFAVWLRSDSYFGFDQMKEIKVIVIE